MWKELRRILNRNADPCNKELATIKKNKSKLDNSIAEIKTNLGAMNSRLDNTKERISGLEDKIMEITQSKQQTAKQMEKKKATYEIYGII